ncbi:MAG: O-antigen ligase family protein [Candidatus Roizmanbacteria bacterium]
MRRFFENFLHLLLTGIIVGLLLGQVGRIEVIFSSIHLYIFEPLIVLHLFICLGMWGTYPIINFSKKFPYVILFFVYCFVTYLLRWQLYNTLENAIGILYFIRIISLFLFCVYFKKAIEILPLHHFLLKWGLRIFIILILIMSFGQYFLYQDLRNLYYQGWDPHLNRMFGLYFDPPLLGAILGLSLLHLLYHLKDYKYRYVTYCITLLLVVGSLLTFSRGGYVALMTVILIYFFKSKMLRIGLVSIGICLFIYFGMTVQHNNESINLLRISTIQSRLEDYQEGIRVWNTSQIIGIGYNRIGAEKHIQGDTTTTLTNNARASFHSSFIIILVTTGIMGLVWCCLLLYRISKTTKFVSIIIMYVSVYSLFDNIMLHSMVILYVFMIVLSEQKRIILDSHNIDV